MVREALKFRLSERNATPVATPYSPFFLPE